MPAVLLDLLKGRDVETMPVWLMRQAGRYLPEYRALRARAGSFLDLCLTPELAAEITLQPVRRFSLDGAILFADILLMPYALGQGLSFKEDYGPVLSPLPPKLEWHEERLEPVFETIRRVKKELSPSAAFLGFCGGFWTLACYMIQENRKAGFEKPLALALSGDARLDRLIDELVEASLAYARRQIKEGIDVFKIFDSHAGLLGGKIFRRLVVEPTKKMVAELKKDFPDIPVIGFPRGAALADYESYFGETGVDALALDQNISLNEAEKFLKPIGLLQGNLDPKALLEGGESMKKQAENIVRRLGPRHIFNLGHGILPQTPPDHVEELVSFVRSLS